MSSKPIIDRGHVGEHLTEVCSACYDFQQGWSQTSGEVRGLKTAVERLYLESTKYFRFGDDDQAKLLRRLAVELESGPLAAASKKLDEYIHRREKATD